MRKSSPRLLIISILSSALLFSGNMKIAKGQKINKNRPSVYLTFKEFPVKSANEAYPSQRVRLILHNNTRWPIYYGKWFDTTLPGDVPVIYNIEQANGCPEERKHVDVVTTGKLMPGKTVSFVVPREDFPKGSHIYVGFWFSWEFSPEKAHGEEPEHRANFYPSYLPDWPGD